MKRSLACPKCDGRVLIHVERVKLPILTVQAGLMATMTDLPITSVPGGWRGPKTMGAFESFICRACGYTEWYAHDTSELYDDPGQGISTIDTTPKATLR